MMVSHVHRRPDAYGTRCNVTIRAAITVAQVDKKSRDLTPAQCIGKIDSFARIIHRYAIVNKVSLPSICHRYRKMYATCTRDNETSWDLITYISATNRTAC